MRLLLRILGVVAVLAYPFLVYVGLSHFSVRGLGLFLLVAVALGVFFRASGRRREQLRAILPSPRLGAVADRGHVVEDRRFVLALPVLINVFFLIVFASSLWGPDSQVERFARLQEDSLSPEEVRYCRAVTVVCVRRVLAEHGRDRHPGIGSLSGALGSLQRLWRIPPRGFRVRRGILGAKTPLPEIRHGIHDAARSTLSAPSSES